MWGAVASFFSEGCCILGVNTNVGRCGEVPTSEVVAVTAGRCDAKEDPFLTSPGITFALSRDHYYRCESRRYERVSAELSFEFSTPTLICGAMNPRTRHRGDQLRAQWRIKRRGVHAEAWLDVPQRYRSRKLRGLKERSRQITLTLRVVWNEILVKQP
jgi:hypothetical protein